MKKRVFAFLALLICVLLASAQEPEPKKDFYRLSVTVYDGAGFGVVRNNMSSYGVHYRNNYTAGMSAGGVVTYSLNDGTLLGAKVNAWATSADYEMGKESTLLSDNVGMTYVALLLGQRCNLKSNFYFDYMIGAGYMHYNSESLYSEIERKATADLFGYNLDVKLAYRLSKRFSVGLGASYVGGKTSSLTEDMGGKKTKVKLDKWNKIRVNRTDVFLALTCFM